MLTITISLTRAIPNDVERSALAERELCAANRAHCHCACRHAVHRNRSAPLLFAFRPAHVAHVAALRSAFEVNEMRGARGINDRLRLDATLGHVLDADVCGACADCKRE